MTSTDWGRRTHVRMHYRGIQLETVLQHLSIQRCKWQQYQVKRGPLQSSLRAHIPRECYQLMPHATAKGPGATEAPTVPGMRDFPY